MRSACPEHRSASHDEGSDLRRRTASTSTCKIALSNAGHERDLPATVERARAAFVEHPSIAAADVLAWVEFKAGNIAEAQTAIEQALRTGTVEPLILFHAGMIYRAAGDAVRAKELLQRVEDQNPRFSLLYAATLSEALNVE